jgi:two-component system KDP operon response regulator KdpE
VKPVKVLGVDNDTKIRKLLTVGLEAYGYHVILADNGEQALVLAAQQAPDVVILDLNLGAEPDGLEVCLRLREWTAVPIVILSVREDQQSKIEALDAGADDYVTKPFDMGELAARIRAVLRRNAIKESGTLSAEIRAHDLVIDLARHRVTLKDKEVHLTPKEYDLLRLLAVHAGKVMTTTALLEQVWGKQKSQADHYIRVYINNIRKKLQDTATSETHYIFTEPGVGYRFTDLAPLTNT